MSDLDLSDESPPPCISSGQNLTRPCSPTDTVVDDDLLSGDRRRFHTRDLKQDLFLMYDEYATWDAFKSSVEASYGVEPLFVLQRGEEYKLGNWTEFVSSDGLGCIQLAARVVREVGDLITTRGTSSPGTFLTAAGQAFSTISPTFSDVAGNCTCRAVGEEIRKLQERYPKPLRQYLYCGSLVTGEFARSCKTHFQSLKNCHIVKLQIFGQEGNRKTRLIIEDLMEDSLSTDLERLNMGFSTTYAIGLTPRTSSGNLSQENVAHLGLRHYALARFQEEEYSAWIDPCDCDQIDACADLTSTRLPTIDITLIPKHHAHSLQMFERVRWYPLIHHALINRNEQPGKASGDFELEEARGVCDAKMTRGITLETKRDDEDIPSARASRCCSSPAASPFLTSSASTVTVAITCVQNE